MDESDPFDGVALFVATARADSFTQAASQLGLTKSGVGKAVARLEERLGFKLFHRSTRLKRLTADGEAYFVACVKAIDEVKAAQDALSSDSRVLSGRVHIDMPVAFGRRVLLPLLMDVTRRHPQLNLTLVFTDATSDLLKDDVDIAIRFGALQDSTQLIARRLAVQSRVICASPAYLRDYGEPGSLGQIRSHRCIVGTTNGPPAFWLVRDGDTERRVVPQAMHQLSDGQAMVDAAVGGLGLVQLPISLVRNEIEQGLLKPVLSGHSSSVDVHAVWPRRGQLSPRVRHVVDELVRFADAGQMD